MSGDPSQEKTDFWKLLKDVLKKLQELMSPIPNWVRGLAVLIVLASMLSVSLVTLYQEIILVNKTIALMPTPNDWGNKSDQTTDFKIATSKKDLYKEISTTTGANITSITNFADTLMDKVLIGIAGALAALFGVATAMALYERSR